MVATLAAPVSGAAAIGAPVGAGFLAATGIACATACRAKQTGSCEEVANAAPRPLAPAAWLAWLTYLAVAGWPVTSPHNAAFDDIGGCRRLLSAFGGGAPFYRHRLHYQLPRHAGGGQDYERFHVCSPNATNPDSATAVHYLRLPLGACFSGFTDPTNIAGPMPLSESSLRPWFPLPSE